MVPRPMRHLAILLILGALGGACRHAPPATAEAGEPLPGLPAEELARFYGGRALFDKVFTPEEGLGPLFNENQCSACHTVPASGGTTGFERIVRVTRYDEESGSCDLLAGEGGENVRTQATPLLKSHGVERQPMPEHGAAVGRFSPSALFGLGLVEAIPDETILGGEDPDDENGDGISGRAGHAADGRVARFGRKAEFATIQDFTEGALRLEMGLTTPAAMNEGFVDGLDLPPEVDPAPEPEVSQGAVDLLATFVRFLAAPSSAAPRSDAHSDSLRAGRRLFGVIGCAECHTPMLRTGPSEIEALDRRTVALYSDLLLHDMGPELADVCGPTAAPGELRTEMLMGLRHRNRLLHDGRTSELREAILAHGGEAQRARDAFARLRWLHQELVVTFLRSL